MISQSLGACWHFWIQDFSRASSHRTEAFFLYSTYGWECEAGVRVLSAFAKVDVFPLGSHRGYTLPNMELFASGKGEVERRRRRRRKASKLYLLIPPGCLRAGAPNHFLPWPGIQTLESLRPGTPKPGMPTAVVMVAKQISSPKRTQAVSATSRHKPVAPQADINWMPTQLCQYNISEL